MLEKIGCRPSSSFMECVWPPLRTSEEVYRELPRWYSDSIYVKTPPLFSAVPLSRRETTSIGLFLFDCMSISSSSCDEKSFTMSLLCFSCVLNYFSIYSRLSLDFLSFAWLYFLTKSRRLRSPISVKRLSSFCHRGC